MYKRALMLTAASVALLSGPAFGAATDITTKTTKPLTSANDGPITIESGGAITIPSVSSTTTPTTAIELNSATAANNILTTIAGSTITYNDTSDAEAIQADPGKTGEIIAGGAINLTGAGTYKSGIVFGDPITAATGIFTGKADSTNNSGNVTALYLAAGSTISVAGNGSSDINVVTGNTVVGDMVIGGALTSQAASLTSVSPSAVTGVTMAGTLTGNLSVLSTGSIIGTGAGAEGIVTTGNISGSLTNYGAIESLGLSSTLTKKQQQAAAAGQSIGRKTTGNPNANSALIVSGNVGGGIYNAGPDGSGSNIAAGVISTTGNQAAVDIVTGYNATTTSTTTIPSVTIGGFSDPDGDFGTVSFLNRGTISGTAVNYDSAAAGMVISGSGTSIRTTLSDGFVNAGTISATAATDTKSSSGTAEVVGLSVGDFVTFGNNTGTANNGFGGGYALVNSNENGNGKITASVSGLGPATAIGIDIGNTAPTGSTTLTSVPSLFNSGTISASALTTDPTISNLAAYGILDRSGSLVNITNSGTISAISGAEVTNTSGATTLESLDNYTNISRAISVQNAISGVTITNTGTITGDILLGDHADTVSVTGASSTQASTITGSIFFGGNIDTAGAATCSNAACVDTLNVNPYGVVTGNILPQGSNLNINVANSGTLTVTNNGSTINNLPLSSYNVTNGNLTVNNLTVQAYGTLGLTVAQPFNQQSDNAGSVLPVVQSSAGTIHLVADSILKLNFGSFIASTNTTSTTSRFVIFDASSGKLIIDTPQQVIADITNDVPFLFNGSVCGYNVSNITGANACTGSNVALEGTGRSDLVLDLTPKAVGLNSSGQADSTHLGLTGYAAKMFPLANQALANDSTLGAEVISAGAGLTGTNIPAQGQKIYQGIYSAFAPDVTGADRAIAISITDQATGPVGARQRALRMYAGLDGDATLWGQEFAQRLNTGASPTTTGYANTGFGFVLGADSGDPHDGRYGGAFTFYSGTTSEKSPRTSKTQSDWAMLTGYSDWRGRHLFVDTQLSAAYGDITGKRSIVIGGAVAKCNGGDTCTATGKRAAAMLAGGVTTGQIYHAGGTVFIPQLSLDGMTMREEGYTENTPNLTSQADSGFDLHVKPFYATSLRAFAGADLRQDLKFGDYFVQPEGRAGFRYDFLSGAEKLKAEFACSTVSTGGCGDTSFPITGPDPAKGNVVVGGSIAVSTGAWSMGLSYDYIKGIDGVKTTDQVASFTLLGRI